MSAALHVARLLLLVWGVFSCCLLAFVVVLTIADRRVEAKAEREFLRVWQRDNR